VAEGEVRELYDVEAMCKKWKRPLGDKSGPCTQVWYKVIPEFEVILVYAAS
jgi:hypothetical protein